METLVALASRIAAFLEELVAAAKEFAAGFKKTIDFPNMQ